MSETRNEILAGSFGGVVQVLTGQPFDTIKVRLQSQGHLYTGTLDCIQKTIKNEGFSAFYKGTMSPLVGIAFCVSIQFGVLGQTKRWFHEQNLDAFRRNPNKQNLSETDAAKLSFGQTYLAGGIAGVANSFVSGPVEHIRTRMQVQTTSAGGKPQYSSTFDCFQKIKSQYGLAGIYKGQYVTFLREFQGYAGYFVTYDLCAQYLASQGNISISELPTYQIILCGAAAGYGMWIPVYPLDVIKSKIQTDKFGKWTGAEDGPKYKNLVDCARIILREEGIKGFYRGMLPCMLRAAPVNAATFVGYEWAMRLISSK